jgi:hypothetical protein
MDIKKLLQSKQVVAILKQLWATLGKKLGVKMPELPIEEEKTPKVTKKPATKKARVKKVNED